MVDKNAEEKVTLTKRNPMRKAFSVTLSLFLMLLGSPCLAAEVADSPFENATHSSDYEVHTFDMPITAKQVNHPDGEGYVEVLDAFPYKTIRTQGALVQVQYSVGAFGRAQWFIMSDLHGVVLMPNSINLPVGEWIKGGLKEGNVVRVIVSVPKVKDAGQNL